MIDLVALGAVFGYVDPPQQRQNLLVLRKAFELANQYKASIGMLDARLQCLLDPLQDSTPVDFNGPHIIGVKHNYPEPIVVEGVSAENSIIEILPDAPTFPFFGIYIDQFKAPRTLVLRNTTLKGPDHPGEPRGKDGLQVIGIRHQGDRSFMANPGVLRLDNARVEGKWQVGIAGSDGDAGLELLGNFYVTGDDLPLNWYATDAQHKYVHLVGNGVIDGGGISNVDGAGMYIHPHVSLAVDGPVRFRNTTRFAIYANGTVRGVPDYWYVNGAIFESSCAKAIQAPAVGMPMIRGVTCHAPYGVQFFGSGQVMGGYFSSPQALQGGKLGALINVRDTIFDLRGQTALGTVACEGSWNIDGARFLGLVGSGSYLSLGAMAEDVWVMNTRFHAQSGNGSASAFGANGGRLRLRNCDIGGDMYGGWMVNDGFQFVDVEQVRFGGGKAAFMTNLTSKSNGKLRGRNNDYGQYPVSRIGSDQYQLLA